MNRLLVSLVRSAQFGYITKALIVAFFLSLALPLHAADRADGYRLLELEGYKVKWGERKLGVGASISYAFADETMRFEEARNCGVLVPMKTLSGQDLPFETLERETAAAFRVWERAADLSFHRVANAIEADIILGAQGEPRMRAFANVSFAPEEEEGVRTIRQSLVCLNPEQKWKVGFGGDKEVYDIRYTLIHEIGHAIGLDHPGPSGQVMGFRYTEAFPGLQPGDLLGIRRLYGRGASGNQLADGPEAHLFKSVP
ncbi:MULTISPECIES: matrixin family metalloprotease [Marinobacter]|uniref:matrixin family metalloprotease n=1 Tax=Marinobacter TaxID=2742 RepID=UPI001928281E|nr:MULTISPECIES: matrixin family metalloprotease [Marinobacter]MBL3556631.1 matrixin family metalloprotease [Marinobacter sp. JB05H06]